MDKIFGSWRTTLLGILGIVAVVLPPVQSWLQSTTHLSASAILALIVALIGAFSQDAHS